MIFYYYPHVMAALSRLQATHSFDIFGGEGGLINLVFNTTTPTSNARQVPACYSTREVHLLALISRQHKHAPTRYT